MTATRRWRCTRSAGISSGATLAAILGFLAAHEPDLVACAEALDIDAEALAAAARRLEGLEGPMP
jgi:hypothetical protein